MRNILNLDCSVICISLSMVLLCCISKDCESCGWQTVDVSSQNRRSGSRPAEQVRERIVDRALRFIDTRYLYGGNRHETGLDCSGFVRLVFHDFGIELPRMARIQSRTGRPVDRKNLRKGDLVFFHIRGNGVDHVGLFIGDDAFVHASKKSGKVKVSRLGNPFWVQRFACARRILPD